MFLLRLKTKRTDTVQLAKDKYEAIELAHDHVGEHNPVDGCSTQPATTLGTTGRIHIVRHSSFGAREAWIIPSQDGVDSVWDL